MTTSTTNKQEMVKTKLSRKINFNLKTCNFIIYSLVFGVCACYLYGINDIAVKGFKLREISVKINEINRSNAELELIAMQLQSYNNVNERVAKLGLVKVDQVNYIKMPLGVAKK